MTSAQALMAAMALLGTAGSALAQTGLAQAGLEPHLAAYRLGLHGAQGASPLVEVRGGLVVEWRLECDGWISRQRHSFVASTNGGGNLNYDIRFTGWETTDGSRLRYVVRSFENDQLREEYRGLAEMEPGDGGVADFTMPRAQTVELPSGTVFPAEHMNLVLQAAAAGKRFVSHEVFDGFGFDALTQVTSVIGEPRPLDPTPGIPPGVEGKMAWPVNIAYFSIEPGEDTPRFEATFLLDDKGVLYDVTLDYGDFRLDANLEKLELLGRPDC